MINGKTILGIIPARGGSKTIPRKNLAIIAGKPLIAWTIEEAGKSKYIDRLILSSEDAEIIEVSKSWGCEVPFIRPMELARDDSSSMQVVIHAIETIREKYDYIVLLQPTSPLRTVTDIDDCIRYCNQQKAPVCVSVCETDNNPYWMHTLNEHQRLCPLMPVVNAIGRRQDLPRVYVENGAVYVAQTDYILKKKNFISEETLAFVMPQEKSWDIDTKMDFLLCEMIKTGALST